MSALLGELGIDALEFGLCCDLKMVLMLCGKQSASSKYCCPFCLGSSPWVGTFPPTTIGGLWESYGAYVEAGLNLNTAMKFHNVVNPPLITGKTNDTILGDIFYFPEHHVFTGIVGKLVKEFERNVFDNPEIGKDFMDEWMVSPNVNITRTVYHGSASFVGNMAEKVLKNLDSLSTKVETEVEPQRLSLANLYLTAFRQFYSVVKACFGQELTQG